VGWGAPTVVEMNLALLRAAVEFPRIQHPFADAAEKIPSAIKRAELAESRAWDYFVLLGHEAVALATLPYIEQFLGSVKHGELFPARVRTAAAAPATANDQNHAKKSLESLGALSIYPTGTNFINCWHANGHDFYGQWEDVISRMETPVIDSHDGRLMEKLYWQAQNGRYYELKRPIPQDLGFEVFKTIQYVALTPDAVKYILYGPETTRILLFLANVKASDELVIPTIFQRNISLSKTAACDNTLHFMHWVRPGGSWHPEYLTMEHLPLLLNTTKHLFARKVNDDSAAVLDALLEVRQLAWLDLAAGMTLPATGGAGSDIKDIKDASKAIHGVNNKGMAYHIQPAIPIHPILVPPIQQPLVMSALSSSATFMRRCIHHIVAVAMTGEGVWPAAGSVEEKAISILQKLFPDFPWVSMEDSSHNSDHTATGKDIDEVKLQMVMQRLRSLQEFWAQWEAQHSDLSISHLHAEQALDYLNELRVHRDAIQERLFIEYWMEKYRQEPKAAKRARDSGGEEL